VKIRHSSSLDVLRGLAILLVVPYSHFLSVEHSIAFALGILGVVLFFFLSGFLMGQTFASAPQFGS
jgi:peptidoglycan/LPS O-acetylase OafA/YrhL